MNALLGALESLAARRVVLFGGKGGVGKTTLSAAAALHYAATRDVILFTTDPASNLGDLLSESTARLTVESLDAGALYSRFLSTHLEPILEIGDRGTYLDREELRRLFELTLPGVDELMAWMHIGELAEEQRESLIVVDTAPTGHTLRMLSSSEHFHGLAVALDAMQEKHRAMVRQFTRREVRDAMDAFIDELDARATRRRALLTDPSQTAFVPVTLPEPLVVQQTARLMSELEIDVPFVILNRAGTPRDAEARDALAPRSVVAAPRACVPLDTPTRLLEWLRGGQALLPVPSVVSPSPPAPEGDRQECLSSTLRVGPLTFLAGKGGVGKTSCSASIALQLATGDPHQQYVVISVDPAHSLPELFANFDRPPNLRVEAIDTRAKWRRFRDSFGEKIVEAVDALTPRGLSLGHDAEAMRRLIEIAPPGADELFAITRLADLLADESLAGVIVDTAPTGHFLRLLDLPRAAGEWVREFMRLLLRYRDLIPAGSLGDELVRASRELKSVDAAIHSERASVIVVTRPERIVVAETKRLLDNLRERGIAVGGVIANYVTPAGGDECDQSMREHELAALSRWRTGTPACPAAAEDDGTDRQECLSSTILIERRATPPRTLDELLSLVPRATLRA